MSVRFQSDDEYMRNLITTSGISIGTQVKTKFMKQFISDTDPTGTYTLDLEATQGRIKAAAQFIEHTGASELIVCSGKDSARVPIRKFAELVGCKDIHKRFMPGTLTNPDLPKYMEPKLLLVCDPQVDAQAVTEATNAGIPVIGIANSDNVTSRLDVIIPANNRGRGALAAIFWLLAREVLVIRGEVDETKPMKYEIDDFETKDVREDE
ncbi:ribosomal protein S2 [Cenarchaeum symbiosum A]|uniref:Small ribosomal subunit protein uS2 n=1 Tax=Cenarchaeum symbiosum (strain A) TaxID=414004 RepID=RS2_CENSY|nr:RecName: Full=Small ribosomal subunit protein uS2; AltName: Full=30S ribosomal protein S2 [Cenarchaeum symbiosum A]ABK78231.1 ribosomal protein S2 [Cenarchaeum symbiosum A]